MALRSGKSKGAVRERTYPRLGSVRRSQLLTTYGVGSLVAIGDQSYLVSGLDTWKVGRRPDLREFRLQTRLGLKTGFFLPPASDPPAGDGVKVRRFPDIYTCPGRDAMSGEGCDYNLRKFREFGSEAASECTDCGGALTPSRFVVACDRGHLDDFPYLAWAHRRPLRADERPGHRLSFHTTGRTAALRSIVIRCSCGEEASMEGAFGRGAMESIRYKCFGQRPWLGVGAEEGCGSTPRTLQRGSSAAWFPIVRSALSIPPFSEQLYDQVLDQDRYELWKGEPDDVIARQAQKAGLVDEQYTAAEIIKAVRDYEAYEAGERPDPSVITGFEPADVLREEEYKQLLRESRTQHFESVRPTASDATLPPGISDTMLVTRLREVRVLQAFTRVDPPMDGDPPERLASLSRDAVGWLPAIEVVGEGVFLSLSQERLRSWEQAGSSGGPADRAGQIRDHHQMQLDERARQAGRTAPRSRVDARLVLVHTLAHALINEWSLDAGYPAAALRERLYVSDTMAGLLIYTATSDSAGSLGGLVGQGELHRLRHTLASALRRISWCSADPLCMESEASGADSLNLAACHACMLLPETSCELANSYLDRALLIGTPDGRTKGYFDGVEAAPGSA
ncbi:DUF1998 domain-containing protein [Actinomadura logoneensis]|uniref:DUF1998 domain-containing protein n=1 Tax=Actinomadura logoneensis TaxID=2293572 RepID=A0A372JQM9_9ACTN|nr:DUF1998 domain-containing protein [Actinomadura logoneensis]RFU42345.1 DUF1998 domain-containing protein [Actinomadura logoneensis]